MDCNFKGSTKNFINDKKALKRDDITTPDKTRFRWEKPPPNLAMRLLMKTARQPKMKAATGTGKEGKKAIERAQPNPAPDEMPRINGSTRGFRSTAWRLTPERAKPMPVSPDRMILGKRISIRIKV
jgi:hypothetical protein